MIHRGFIQIPFLVTFVLGILAVGGIGYVAYQAGKTSEINEQVETEMEVSTSSAPMEGKTTTPKATTPPPEAPLVQDQSLRIAQCQADARLRADEDTNKLLQLALPVFQKLIDQAHASYLTAKTKQSNCILDSLPAELIGASPAVQDSYRDSCINSLQPTVDYYSSLEDQYADEWEAKKQDLKRQGQGLYNSYYAECLN